MGDSERQPPIEDGLDAKPRWDAGWDGHEQAQLERFARLTLAEKLEWLEEAQQLVQQLQQRGPACTAEEPAVPASGELPAASEELPAVPTGR